MKVKLVLLCSLWLAACSSQPDTSVIALNPTEGGQMQLQVSNQALGERLQMGNIKTRQTNGLLEAAVTLQSQYKKSQYLQYQFVWYDAQGFALKGAQSPWRALTLEGFGQQQVGALAPNGQATTFAVAVREVSTEAQEFDD